MGSVHKKHRDSLPKWTEKYTTETHNIICTESEYV